MMPELNPSNWFLAQLKPNCAPLAVRNLTRQGFATFLPLERTTLRKGGQLRACKRPYFPGYLFVGIDDGSAPWRAINSTQGIARLVQFGGEPAPVPSSIVDGLRRACDEEGCVVAQGSLASGDNVRVAAGPFTDLVGRIKEVAANERAWVLIDVMGKATQVSLRQSDLRKAS